MEHVRDEPTESKPLEKNVASQVPSALDNQNRLILRAKLSVGAATDRPERTANDVAAQVVAAIQRQSNTRLTAPAPGPVGSARDGTEVESQIGRIRPKVSVSRTGMAVQRGYEELQEKTTISDPADLDEPVERLVDDRFGGIDNLFLKGDAGLNSSAAWAAAIYSNLTDPSGAYELDNLHRPDVLAALMRVKSKYRNEVLLRLSYNRVYMSDTVFPYSADNLWALLTDAGLTLDDGDADDKAVVKALFETEGKHSRTEVDVAAGDLKLLDEDGVVVVLDSHQNKHQLTLIQEIAQYQGDPGSKFSGEKNLAWHVANTATVVKARVLKAITDGDVGPNAGPLSPAKVPQADTYIYDLVIDYDKASGKSVGVYHCNPQQNE